MYPVWDQQHVGSITDINTAYMPTCGFQKDCLLDRNRLKNEYYLYCLLVIKTED